MLAMMAVSLIPWAMRIKQLPGLGIGERGGVLMGWITSYNASVMTEGFRTLPIA